MAGWDYSGKGPTAPDVMQQIRDAYQATPGNHPAGLADLVSRCIESLAPLGNAPTGKLWQAQSTGDLTTGDMTITISTADDPAAKAAADAKAKAAAGEAGGAQSKAPSDQTIPQASGSSSDTKSGKRGG